MRNDALPERDFKRHRIEGLDCAQCAVDRVAQPGGRNQDTRLHDGALPHLLRMGGAAFLLAAGVIFNGALHRTPGAVAEYAVLITAYLLVGAPVLLSAARNVIHGRVFDEMFLMSIATLGAIVIHELPEAAAVMLFYSIGEYVQDLAVDRSRRSIKSLVDLRPDSARVVGDGGVAKLAPEEVSKGSTIEVLPGERIPLDGDIVFGASAVDTSALTGESVPRTVTAGDSVLAGFVNDGGKLRVRVSRPFAQSSLSRVLRLVEDASSRKAPTEKFITRFAAIYTPIVVAIAAVIAFLPPLLLPGTPLSDWVYRALVILVISCPCALVVSIPLAYFGGIGAASHKKVLVKGANFLDALEDVTTVVVDKTGTITKGAFRVSELAPRNGYGRDELLRWAAVAEEGSTHPIARAVREAYEARKPAAPATPAAPITTTDDLRKVHEEKGFGVRVTVDGTVILAGSDRLLHREGVPHSDCDAAGTVVHVAIGGSYAGHIVVSDEIKEEAAASMARLREAGVRRVVMLTGDKPEVAQRIAAKVGIDELAAGLLPEEKVQRVEELQAGLRPGEKLAFVGDGINDAPVLMRADVGIAMGDIGSDAAIEAADIVLQTGGVDGIPAVMQIARATRRIVYQNIIFAIVVKLAFLALGAVGVATMWEAVIGDMGVALIAVLNATRALNAGR